MRLALWLDDTRPVVGHGGRGIENGEDVPEAEAEEIVSGGGKEANGVRGGNVSDESRTSHGAGAVMLVGRFLDAATAAEDDVEVDEVRFGVEVITALGAESISITHQAKQSWSGFSWDLGGERVRGHDFPSVRSDKSALACASPLVASASTRQSGATGIHSQVMSDRSFRRNVRQVPNVNAMRRWEKASMVSWRRSGRCERACEKGFEAYLVR